MPAPLVDVAAFVERTCSTAGTTVEVTNPDALHHLGVILAERATTPGPTPEVVAHEIPDALTTKPKGTALHDVAA